MVRTMKSYKRCGAPQAPTLNTPVRPNYVYVYTYTYVICIHIHIYHKHIVQRDFTRIVFQRNKKLSIASQSSGQSISLVNLNGKHKISIDPKTLGLSHRLSIYKTDDTGVLFQIIILVPGQSRGETSVRIDNKKTKPVLDFCILCSICNTNTQFY